MTQGGEDGGGQVFRKDEVIDKTGADRSVSVTISPFRRTSDSLRREWSQTTTTRGRRAAARDAT